MRLLQIIFLCILSFWIYAAQVADYQAIFIPGQITNSASPFIALRAFNIDHVPYFLVVNTSTLETQVIPATNFTQIQTHASSDSLYLQLLNQYTGPPYPLENSGLTHVYGSKNGNILSIDLCPSSKPFEAFFFKKLVDLSDVSHHATPVAISISGKWMKTHPKEFQWLLDMQKQDKLAITWVNHSFSHPYKRDLEYKNNFLLMPNTDLKNEILLTEENLIEAGVIPSIFFRLPGLVGNKHINLTLRKFGLIPLGADAWLALDQPITPGGIILVHGNGNEHEGIIRLLPFLTKLRLLSITQALVAQQAKK